jgi:hypothetical protein
MKITIQEIESAINFWRKHSPATGEECALSQEVNCLATEYAMMIFEHRHEVLLEGIPARAQDLIQQWKKNSTI